MIALAKRLHGLLDATRALDFLAPLALRLYLAPVFWMAGTKKLANFESTAQCGGEVGNVSNARSRGTTVPCLFARSDIAVISFVSGQPFASHPRRSPR